MKELGEYLSKHQNQDFWKEAMTASAGSLVARNQTLKIEAGKLRNEKNRLILDNISQIMEGELKRTEIRDELREIKSTSIDDLRQQLREIEELPRQQIKQSMIQHQQELLDIFKLPDILSSFETTNPKLRGELAEKVERSLKELPKLRAALIGPTDLQRPESAVCDDKYLQYRKLIECKDLNDSDLYLLETEYEQLVSEKLKRRALGKYLVQLWLHNTEREVFWARDAAQLKEQFERQKHF